MALQTSGAISLDQIHVEAGGTSGSAVSMNDEDVQALLRKGSGASLAFSELYGAYFNLDIQTVTVGRLRLNSVSPYNYGYFDNYGGSIYDGTSNLYTGQRAFDQISWWDGGASSGSIILTIIGNHVNSGWTNMKIGSITLNRSSASHSVSSGTSKTSWNWSGQSNLFGTTVGASVQVVFT